MKIDAVGVTTSNMKKTIEFYSLIGFDFSDANPEDGHVEPKTPEGSARLMIDAQDIVKSIINEDPKPGNHSNIAIRFSTSEEVDRVAKSIQDAGFTIIKKPWDSFWNQRYAIVEDPDGYKIDLYADLKVENG